MSTSTTTNDTQRASIEQRAAAMIDKAKAQVMMQHPLWSALLMRLRVRADWRARTMYADGRVIGYNPSFVVSRTIEDLVFILVHEVGHCVLGHPMRMRAVTDRDMYNRAADHAVNLLLARDPRLVLPKDTLADKQYTDLNVETIYAHLKGVEKQKQDEEAAQRKQDEPEQQQDDDSDSDAGDDDAGDDNDDSGGEDESGDDSGASDDDTGDDGDDSDDGESNQDGDGDAKGGKSGKSKSKGDGEQSKDDEIGGGSAYGDIIAPGEASMPGDDEPSAFDKPDDSDNDSTANDASDEARDEHQDIGDETTNDEAADEALMREWQEAVAAAALGAGDEADEVMERAIRKYSAQRQSFAEVLERFLTQRVTVTDDWGRRNRRFQDVYLPSRGGSGMKRAVFAIDTSASINEKMLGEFQDAICRVYEEASLAGATVVYCDTSIRRVDEYESAPEFESAPGGGGTKFAPVFQYVRERIAEGDEIAAVIYLTDQENFDTAYVHEFSEIPTLWVNPGIVQEAPFGEACSLLD